MDVITHKNVTVNPAGVALCGIDKKIQITHAVAILEKNSAPIVTPLDDVQRIARNEDSGSAGHA
jgi:hypothetical protein